MQILQLESHLKDQQVVRGALEKALGPDPDHPAPVNLSLESPMLKVKSLPVFTIFHSLLAWSIQPWTACSSDHGDVSGSTCERAD